MSQISGDDRDKAMQIHNDARSALGSQPLVWDDNLGQQAARWAQHLADIGQIKHNQDPTTPAQGENLYAESGTDPSTLGQQSSQCWINEKPNYHGESIGDGDFGSYGHYTQAVWPSTTNIGIGFATGKNGWTYVVGRYSPPGNITGGPLPGI